MKQLLAIFVCAAFLCTLSGCLRDEKPITETPSSSPSSSAEELPPQPLYLDTLAIEIPRDYAADDAALLRATSALPALLTAALAEADVAVERITVSVGASASATCQALERGTVDLAFLPADSYLESGSTGTVLLSDADQDFTAGRQVQICTAPSAYGRSLAQRAGSSNPLTWSELDHARWGVLAPGSDLGWRYPSLWLADHYNGLLLEDLGQITVYQNFEEILLAAAREEIDLFPMTSAMLTEYSAAWMLETGRSDDAGHSGFGRELPMEEEIRIIDSTEPVPTAVAVTGSSEDLAGDAFASALAQALNSFSKTAEGQQLLSVLGAPRYARTDNAALDPLRRILTMEGALL